MGMCAIRRIWSVGLMVDRYKSDFENNVNETKITKSKRQRASAAKFASPLALVR